MRIEDSGLSTRAINALRRNKIFTLEEAKKLPYEQLAELKGVGEIIAQEIITEKQSKPSKHKDSLLDIACKEYCRFYRDLGLNELR